MLADLPYTRPQHRKVAYYIRHAGLSPTGARAVFEARGEIFTVPAQKGDIRNLTRTPGAHERYPAWSPDGQRVAYFSDASGEYELHLADQTGLQEKTVIPLGKTGFFYSPVWSPDSTKIAYTDKALNLFYLDLEQKTPILVDTDTFDHPERSLDPAWSPDSRWLAYTRRLPTQLHAVFLYELATGQRHQVTDGLSDARYPCFSRDGKYLFLAASADFGLNTGWLDMSSFERPTTSNLYVAVLSKAEPSPLAPESDEEHGSEQTKDKGDKQEAEQQTQTGDKGDKKETESKTPPPVVIDLDGLDQRIVALPAPPHHYLWLQAGDHRLFYAETQPSPLNAHGPLLYTLHSYDLQERKCECYLEDIRGYWLSADGKKLLYQGEKEAEFYLLDAEKKPESNGTCLDLEEMEAYCDPLVEWRQMFDEVSRIQRDYFYDPHMHGLDWDAICAKYRPFLAHVGHRSDLNYIFGEMFGELVVGHVYVSQGDIPGPCRVPGGLLGADYDLVDGFYRLRRIYPGQSWHPELRAPLTEPGVNVAEGDYILAVNGQPLRAPTNIHQLLEKTAERMTALRVGPTTDDKDARTVIVRPIESEAKLRHWFWVESNRRKVEQLSGGRVAYVYLSNTGVQGYAAFNRYYFSQLDKQAVVIDERFNGGGSIADYIIDLLDRPLLCYWATREGRIFASPNASILGPKVMIINEYAGSGGDALPLFFRRRGLGKLVGKRTWGGLVGIYDYPELLDGGRVTAPRMAIVSPTGEWEVENEGVSPDVEVEMTPRLVNAGQDPQLEKAVELVLAELERNPPPAPQRPAPPHRARVFPS